jgi:hypothetical protein
MDAPDLPAWKYQHDGRGGLGPGRKKFCAVSAVLALVVAIALFPFGLAACLVPLIAWASAPKRLLVGPRYLICGGRIVYYGNVARLALDRKAGRLTLTCGDGQTLVVEADKFPTNARKSHKVAANKAAKFAKVAERIVDKVRSASPAAEFHGVAG